MSTMSIILLSFLLSVFVTLVIANALIDKYISLKREFDLYKFKVDMENFKNNLQKVSTSSL